MQKFLVCPAIGGAAITFEAVKYLVKNYGEGIDPIFEVLNRNPDGISDSHGQVGFVEQDLYSPLLTEWWRLFKSRHTSASKEFTFAENVTDSSELPFLWGDYAGIRNMLIPFIERMEGHYVMFDKLNNDTPLRVVEVPDGYYCGISEDPETGCEFVEEYPRLWHARSDDEYKFIALVKRFVAHDASTHDWYVDDKVYDISTVGGVVTIVLSGKYGAARCKNDDGEVKYLFLRKNEYYKATGEHPERVIFEINDLIESRFSLNDPFKDADAVLAYARLVTLLENESKEMGQ